MMKLRVPAWWLGVGLACLAMSLPVNGQDSTPAATASEDPTAATRAEASQEERLEELLQLVSDNTYSIHKREMPAYWGLLEKAQKQSLSSLLETARPNPRFNDFYTAASKHRGELVKLTLHVRRVISYPVENENRIGAKELYELWGWTDEAKAWMYCAVTADLPEGFPRSGDVQEKVTLVGYFLKLQAYQPGDAAPNAKPLVAPLLLGKIDWTREPPKKDSDFGNWPMYVVMGVGAMVMLRVVLQVRGFSKTTRSRSMYKRRPLPTFDDSGDESNTVRFPIQDEPPAHPSSSRDPSNGDDGIS